MARTWFALMVGVLLAATPCWAQLELLGGRPQGGGGEAAPPLGRGVDPEALEAGATVTLQGRVVGSGSSHAIVGPDGRSFALLGWKGGSAIVEDLSAVAVMVPAAGGTLTLGFKVDSHPARSVPRDFLQVAGTELLRALDPSLPAQAAEGPLAFVSFPKAAEREAKEFLGAFGVYVRAANEALASLFRASGVPAEPASPGKLYSRIEDLSWGAHQKNQGLFATAMGAHERYVARLRATGALASADPRRCFVLVDKKRFLLAVVERGSGKTIFMTPVSYGAHPSGGQKRYSGDLRTPQCAKGQSSPDATPLSIGRRVPGTVAVGMTVRCMEVASSRPEDRFWADPDSINIAIHGSPAGWSMGLRVSHGCFRVQEQRVATVYDLTYQGMPLVVVGPER